MLSRKRLRNHAHVITDSLKVNSLIAKYLIYNFKNGSKLYHDKIALLALIRIFDEDFIMKWIKAPNQLKSW